MILRETEFESEAWFSASPNLEKQTNEPDLCVSRSGQGFSPRYFFCWAEFIFISKDVWHMQGCGYSIPLLIFTSDPAY